MLPYTWKWFNSCIGYEISGSGLESELEYVIVILRHAKKVEIED